MWLIGLIGQIGLLRGIFVNGTVEYAWRVLAVCMLSSSGLDKFLVEIGFLNEIRIIRSIIRFLRKMAREKDHE